MVKVRASACVHIIWYATPLRFIFIFSFAPSNSPHLLSYPLLPFAAPLTPSSLLLQLKLLHLASNRLSTLPHAVGKLVLLERLYLNNNALTSLRPAVRRAIQPCLALGLWCHTALRTALR